MTAVTHRKALGLPMVMCGKSHHLEQLTHLVLTDEFHRLCAFIQWRLRHPLGQTQIQ